MQALLCSIKQCAGSMARCGSATAARNPSLLQCAPHYFPAACTDTKHLLALSTVPSEGRERMYEAASIAVDKFLRPDKRLFGGRTTRSWRARRCC